VDWKRRSFHFESIDKTIPKYKVFPISMLESKHDYACENIVKTSQRMHKLKRERNIGGNQGSKHFKSLFVGVRTFIQAAKKGDAFFVYGILAPDLGSRQHEIPI
jgi:hypothetical protein